MKITYQFLAGVLLGMILWVSGTALYYHDSKAAGVIVELLIFFNFAVGIAIKQ